MNWFEQLTGFRELNPEQVRASLDLNGTTLRSRVNGRKFETGILEVPLLKDLRDKVNLVMYEENISVTEKIGDVTEIHLSPENHGALIQAASQFNLLEMVNPEITPEEGVGIYERDHTQGPACAIACGAGTIYRNYFVEVNQQIGQSLNNQINCLEDLAVALGNTGQKLIAVKNGYAFASRSALESISNLIRNLNEKEREDMKGLLRVGIQWNTQVTLNNSKNRVSQIYCSALPIAYSDVPQKHWEDFARLILEATYEAALYAGLLNYQNTGNPKVFLTLVGGGAFGNPLEWITEARDKAIAKFEKVPLEIILVRKSIF